MVFTYELDLDLVKMNRRAKYLGRRSFRSKVIVQTHTNVNEFPMRTIAK